MLKLSVAESAATALARVALIEVAASLLATAPWTLGVRVCVPLNSTTSIAHPIRFDPHVAVTVMLDGDALTTAQYQAEFFSGVAIELKLLASSGPVHVRLPPVTVGAAASVAETAQPTGTTSSAFAVGVKLPVT
jgi:hypothetical protein